MKFKYHKSYRGYYLLEDNKFKRPYQKLDQEKTLKNLNREFGFDKNQILEIEESAVVFVKQRIQRKCNKIKKKLILKY